jgi:hypothetical protein
VKVRLVTINDRNIVASSSFYGAVYLCAESLRNSDIKSAYVSVGRVGSEDVDWYCIYYTDTDSGGRLYNFVESEAFINNFRKAVWHRHDVLAGLITEKQAISSLDRLRQESFFRAIP